MLVNSKNELSDDGDLDRDLLNRLFITKNSEEIQFCLKKRGIEASLKEIESVVKSLKFLNLPRNGIEEVGDDGLENVIGGKFLINEVLNDIFSEGILALTLIAKL